MASLRRADVFDLLAMQEANLVNLPENYVMKYYFYHALSWPQLLTVAYSPGGKLVGYVLAKMEEDDPLDKHGHVTSVAVLRQNRKLGFASKLMRLTQTAMEEVYAAEYASLHVRVTNRAAYSLYKHKLHYRIHEVDFEYYADKEDAFSMRSYFHPPRKRGKGRGRECEEAQPAAATAEPAASSTSATTHGSDERGTIRHSEKNATPTLKRITPARKKVEDAQRRKELAAQQQQQQQQQHQQLSDEAARQTNEKNFTSSANLKTYNNDSSSGVGGSASAATSSKKKKKKR